MYIAVKKSQIGIAKGRQYWSKTYVPSTFKARKQFWGHRWIWRSVQLVGNLKKKKKLQREQTDTRTPKYPKIYFSIFF